MTENELLSFVMRLRAEMVDWANNQEGSVTGQQANYYIDHFGPRMKQLHAELTAHGFIPDRKVERWERGGGANELMIGQTIRDLQVVLFRLRARMDYPPLRGEYDNPWPDRPEPPSGPRLV